MSRTQVLTHQFVKSIPDKIAPGILYVSMEYGMVAHLCACGCGREVMTPLTPTDWKLTYDGDAITLHPSIGNWGFPCRSHYWIKSSQIVRSGNMSDAAIAAGRQADRRKKERYYASQYSHGPLMPVAEMAKLRQGLWARLKKWWFS